MDHNPYQHLFEQLQLNSRTLKTEPIKNRKDRLRKMKAWILNNKDRIRAAVYQDLHKSETEVDIVEIFTVISEVNHALKSLKQWTQPKSVPSGLTFIGTEAVILPEPKGICLIIAPWNFPFQLICVPLVSCLAAGNTALLKPSEHTSATSALLVDMISKLYNKDIVSVVEGGVKETTELLSLPFDHMFFTGSIPVGKIVMTAAAKHLSSVTLELGGKSPVIIDNTAQIEDAAEKIAWGKFTNCGQICVAPDYVYVQHSHMDIFIEALKIAIQRCFDNQKSGFDQSETYSRIIHQNHTLRLAKMLDDVVAKGAKLVFGGQVQSDNKYMSPTIVIDMPMDSSIWSEEIFGPILPIISYQHIDEVLSHINGQGKPLALYLFSQDRSMQRKIAMETSSGSMTINDVVLQYSHPNLPFGGVGNSGMGRSHGYAGFLAFSNEKSILKQRVGVTIAKFFYPPYTPFKKWLVHFLIKYL